MAPTPYPQDFLHSGSARPIELDVALTVPVSGDIIISVSGDISNYGWPSIPVGKKMVVTIGRGTPYEAKYLVSTITFGVSSSTLTVLAADRGFDGTLPVEAPAGTIVEHTISATEVALLTEHMQTKQAHGSDGNLVDQNSAQALTNKTFPTPTAGGHPATKDYVDTQVLPPGYQNYTPTFSTFGPTQPDGPWSVKGRYRQNGKHVHVYFKCLPTSTLCAPGVGTYELSLPTPALWTPYSPAIATPLGGASLQEAVPLGPARIANRNGGGIYDGSVVLASETKFWMQANMGGGLAQTWFTSDQMAGGAVFLDGVAYAQIQGSFTYEAA